MGGEVPEKLGSIGLRKSPPSHRVKLDDSMGQELVGNLDVTGSPPETQFRSGLICYPRATNPKRVVYLVFAYEWNFPPIYIGLPTSTLTSFSSGFPHSASSDRKAVQGKCFLSPSRGPRVSASGAN